MKLIIKQNYDSCATYVAELIARRINSTKGKQFVLCLPTGSTPLGVYKKLIDMCNKGEVSFKNVVTFNMDEYVGLLPENEQSYSYYMWNNFFNHIDIDEDNVNLLNGMATDPDAECVRYEAKIKKCGGLDLVLGGVGTDGHIAFNEPFSSLASRTRLEHLNATTIKDNSRFFSHNIELTPKMALTIGVGTIMDADEVVIMATGSLKANAVRDAVEGKVTHASTISALQMHKNSMIICDEDATNELKVKTVKYFKGMGD